MFDARALKGKAFGRKTAIVGGEGELMPIERVGKERDMTKPERAFGPARPVKGQVEIDARRVGMQAENFFNRPQRRGDLSRDEDIAGAVAADCRLGPFEIGDLGLAGLLEDAVAGVPVRLQRNVVEMSMRQSADAGHVIAESKPLDREAATTIKPRGYSTRHDVYEAVACARTIVDRRGFDASGVQPRFDRREFRTKFLPPRFRDVRAKIACPQPAQLFPLRVAGFALLKHRVNPLARSIDAGIVTSSDRPARKIVFALFLHRHRTGSALKPQGNRIGCPRGSKRFGRRRQTGAFKLAQARKRRGDPRPLGIGGQRLFGAIAARPEIENLAVAGIETKRAVLRA